MFRKIAIGLLAAALMLPVCLAEGETAIVLGEEITVNGAAIGQDASAAVYLDTRIETHEDVPEELLGLENRVVTITDGGIYRVSGEGKDLQLRVAADEDDEVRIVLDNAKITCRTAPAIAVISAADPREAGKYAVTIELPEVSFNLIEGSHTEKTEDMDIKLSGAITSLVSVGFEGSGFLEVEGDNEGIEVKNGHMTFNVGMIAVNSGDDALNASEDNVSVITINDGNIRLKVKLDKGGEGDGIDSNGSIVINGGSVVSYAHPDSMDSGIDSDLGCTINGGIVLAMGNMYDEISTDSKQLFMTLQFAQKVEDKLVLTDLEGKVAAVAHLPDENSSYSSFVLSTPDLRGEGNYYLAEGDYYLYIGGEISLEGDETVYTPGKQMQHGGAFSGRMGFGMPEMTEGFEFPGGMPEMPEGFEFPGGMEFPEGMQPPQMGIFDPGMQPGRGFGGEESAEMSTVFHLAPGSTMFSGIVAVE